MSILRSTTVEFNRRIYDESVWRIEKILDMISEQEIWFRPNDQSNSIGHLIIHLCGNVTQWIGSGIGGMPDLRERHLEFNPSDQPNKDILLTKLHALRPLTDRALSTLYDDGDLLNARSVQGYDETVLSILIHVIEHFSYHTGQIAIIAKYIKGVDLGFYAGQDLNAKS